jgi:N-methylhydantoinase B
VPVGQRIDTAQRVVDVVLGALAQVAPERVLAACNSVVTSAIFSGDNPATGQYFVYLETIAGGSGAHSRGDGLSGVQVHMTNTSNLPVEALEREYPILVERYELIRDSGGAGRYRGGLGIRRDFRILHDGLSFTGLGDRHKFAPWGIEGGKSGAPGSFWVERQNEPRRKLKSKVSGVVLNREDLVSIHSPGAGGYGDPYLRPEELVLRDVREGKVSAESAKHDYGVVLVRKDGDYAIDHDATRVCRTAARP